MAKNAPVFAGSIPENYNKYLVPLVFDNYASDLAGQVTLPNGGRVLELACGTGAVTRQLRKKLSDSVHLVSTDLNPGMLEIAQGAMNTSENLEFKIADGTELPFEDDTFDAVVCQFGVMFFPDKSKAYSEVRRVLKPAGQFHFSVWDSIETNPLFQLTHEAMIGISPEINFMALPFGYSNVSDITEALRSTGFDAVHHTVEPRVGRTGSEEDVVRGMIDGSPLAAELEQGGVLDAGRSAVRRVVQESFGGDRIEVAMQAIVFRATSPG